MSYQYKAQKSGNLGESGEGWTSHRRLRGYWAVFNLPQVRLNLLAGSTAVAAGALALL